MSARQAPKPEPPPPVLRLEHLIEEVQRELKLRDRVYPMLVDKGKLTAAAADEQTRRMVGVLLVLRQVDPSRPLPQPVRRA